MKKPLMTILAFAALFAASLIFADTPKITVLIASPANGGKVSELVTVEGTVSDPQADVLVVVHPTAGQGGYWVQQPATVNNDGKWEASQVHFGQGAQGAGETFEVRAFVGPKGKLHTGQVLQEWPAADARSNVVKVTRI